jgi:hypothetical protein
MEEEIKIDKYIAIKVIDDFASDEDSNGNDDGDDDLDELEI